MREIHKYNIVVPAASTCNRSSSLFILLHLVKWLLFIEFYCADIIKQMVIILIFILISYKFIFIETYWNKVF